MKNANGHGELGPGDELVDKVTKAAREERPTGNCSTCKVKDCPARARLAGEPEREYADRLEIARRMCLIKHKIAVFSCKGGVGKSTVAANLAVYTACRGHKVGLLDVDVHGPSIPRLLGLSGQKVSLRNGEIVPLSYGDSLLVMSIGFLLGETKDAVIWRGPMKMGLIKRFLRDISWGELDFLVIDVPPGTGDEPLSVFQLVPSIDGVVLVTTSQEIALDEALKTATFCSKLEVKVLGVIENMSGVVCPHCGNKFYLFPPGGGAKLARDLGVVFLGEIPFLPEIARLGDSGRPFVGAVSEAVYAEVFERALKETLSE